MTTTNWIDISVPIYTGMVHWPDNPPVRVDFMLHMDRGDICLPIKITGSDGGPARAILRKIGGEE